MVIFDFEEEATGSKHGVIATSKCVPSGIFRWLHLCQVSFALLHYLAEIFLILCHTTVLSQPMDVISDYICIIGKLEYLWNKKRHHKKKNANLLYIKKPFK